MSLVFLKRHLLFNSPPLLVLPPDLKKKLDRATRAKAETKKSAVVSQMKDFLNIEIIGTNNLLLNDIFLQYCHLQV